MLNTQDQLVILSDLKQENTIQQSANDTKMLSNLLKDNLLQINQAGVILDFNHQNCSIFIKKLSKNSNIKDIFPNHILSLLQESIAEVQAQENNLSFHISEEIADKQKNYEIRIERIDEKNILLIIRELEKTLAKKASARKSIFESKFLHFSELLPQTVFECNLQGDIQFINKNGLKLLGYSQTSLNPDFNIKHIVAPSEIRKLSEFFLKSISSRKFSKEDFFAQQKSGTLFPAVLHISPMMQENKAIGFIGILFDISEQKKIESEFAVAQKMAKEANELKSVFLANLSHELRTPMNGVLGFSELLTFEENLSTEAKEYVNIINKSAIHLRSMIDDIIDLVKLDQGEIKISENRFNLNNLMNDVYVFYKNNIHYLKKDIELIVSNSLTDSDSEILSDSYKLKQILNNLLSNAVKFTESGKIEIGYILKNPKTLLFYVKDTGIGLTEDVRKNIFTRYKQADNAITRKYNGNGLGLSISKDLVNMLGGELSVESPSEKGSTFYFTLPFNR